MILTEDPYSQDWSNRGDGLVHSTDGLVDSTDGLVDSTDELLNSTNGLRDSNFGLLDSSFGFLNSTNALLDSSVGAEIAAFDNDAVDDDSAERLVRRRVCRPAVDIGVDDNRPIEVEELEFGVDGQCGADPRPDSEEESGEDFEVIPQNEIFPDAETIGGGEEVRFKIRLDSSLSRSGSLSSSHGKEE